MHNRFVFISSLVAIAVLAVMLNFTTPTTAGPFGVLLFFTTLYVAIFGAVTGGNWILRKMMGKRKMTGKSHLYNAVIAFGPVILLLMQGFSGISILTVLLTILAVFLGCFLVYKKA